MNALCIPVPLDNWDVFHEPMVRFCDSWRAHPPGVPCTLFAMCRHYDADWEVKEIFRGLPVEFGRYDGDGQDIGTHQHCAFQIGDAFQISVSSRVHFHRAGWFKEVLRCRDYFGSGLYGAMASNETGVPHFRTCFYGMDAADFRRYPCLINCREMCWRFEHGKDRHPQGSLLQWYQREIGKPTVCVYWDGGWREHEWFGRPNIFRTGNQSNLIAFDRHTDWYFEASPEEKNHTHNRAFYG